MRAYSAATAGPPNRHATAQHKLAAIGQALGMPAPEAASLLTRRQWREGDVARLQAAAARLGVQAPGT